MEPNQSCRPESRQLLASLTTAKFLLDSYIPSLVVIGGVVGNTIAVVIMAKPKHRRTTTGFYLTVIGVLDNVELVTYWGDSYLPILVRNSPAIQSDVWCKAWNFANVSQFGVLSWLVVLFSVERFYITYFPLRPRIFTLKRVRLLAALAFALGCATRAPYLTLTYYDQALGRCHWHVNALASATNNLVFGLSYVHAGTLVALNSLMAVKIAHSAKARARVSNQRVVDADSVRVTVSLQIVAWAFALIPLPWFVFHAFVSQYDEPAVVLFCDPEFGALAIAFGYSLTLTLALTNHATNFWIYFVAFKGFRADLAALFGRARHLPSKGERPATLTNSAVSTSAGIFG